MGWFCVWPRRLQGGREGESLPSPGLCWEWLGYHLGVCRACRNTTTPLYIHVSSPPRSSPPFHPHVGLGEFVPGREPLTSRGAVGFSLFPSVCVYKLDGTATCYMLLFRTHCGKYLWE